MSTPAGSWIASKTHADWRPEGNRREIQQPRVKAQSKQALRERTRGNRPHRRHWSTEPQPAPLRQRYAVLAAQRKRTGLVEVMVQLVGEEDRPRSGNTKDFRQARAPQ